MTCREKLAIERPEKVRIECRGGCRGCPSDYGYMADPIYCGRTVETCTRCWDRDIPEETNVLTPEAVNKACEALGYNHPEDVPSIGRVIHMNEENGGLTFTVKPHTDDVAFGHIKDSGNRREFDSGAVRDMAEGKGRCDLMPLDVVGSLMPNPNAREILHSIYDFQETGFTTCLNHCLFLFGERYTDQTAMQQTCTTLLEVAKHFEEGCKKYGENNWRKGIPVKFYIDSAVRHYLKYLRGDKDEPHDRAFCWNILCAIWTHNHKPELRINPEEPKTE